MPLRTTLHSAAHGFFVGEMMLDNPAALNALSVDIVRDARAVLGEWARDDSIFAVVLCGAGGRAFCAGGDVRFVRRCICDGELAAAEAYFADEYLLDYELHCFAKPLICWGGGVVMGGGMGIFQGCDVRVVTPKTITAMPEGKIGFFPDVGAAFFMKKFKESPQTGYYLGLSGRVFDGPAAVQIGAADFLLAEDSYCKMRAALCAAAQKNADAKTVVREAVRQLQIQNPPPSLVVAEIFEAAEKCARAAEIGGAEAAIMTLPEATRNAASPLSLRVWSEYYRCRSGMPEGENGAKSSADRACLRETFAQDYALARNFLRRGDFAEGVRALLIDKDNTPQWRAANNDSAVAAMFESFGDKTAKDFNQRLEELDSV